MKNNFLKTLSFQANGTTIFPRSSVEELVGMLSEMLPLLISIAEDETIQTP